jgi:hypothetical protein
MLTWSRFVNHRTLPATRFSFLFIFRPFYKLVHRRHSVKHWSRTLIVELSPNRRCDKKSPQRWQNYSSVNLLKSSSRSPITVLHEGRLALSTATLLYEVRSSWIQCPNPGSIFLALAPSGALSPNRSYFCPRPFLTVTIWVNGYAMKKAGP